MPLHHYGRIPRPGRLVCAVWFRRPGGCRREWSSTDVSRHKNDSYGAQGCAVVVLHFESPNEVRFGGHFLPYDVGNFEFSSQLGLRESDQEQGIYNLNQNVLNAGPTPAEQALIEGWYVMPINPVRARCWTRRTRRISIRAGQLRTAWRTTSIKTQDISAQPLLFG